MVLYMGWMFSHGAMMTPWNAFNNDAFQIKRGTAEVGFSGLWESHVVYESFRPCELLRSGGTSGMFFVHLFYFIFQKHLF
jgi:hypothetical protein